MEVMKILNNTADLDKMFYSNNSYRAWIGLSRDNWRWSLSDPSFYKPGETEFRRWNVGEPNVGYSNNACTGMRPDGLWFDDSCKLGIFPVCADIKGSNVTFVIIPSPITWTKAQSYCRALYTDLASVRNMTENQKVQALTAGGNLVWIGLFRDSWKWSDGSNSSFSFWKNGQPDNNNGNKACVAADFSQSGAWEDWPCDMERAFICFGPVVSKKVMKVKFENKKNLDLNDSAVMEAMLKQLKQKLRAQGLDDNIKLSWRKQADGKVFHKEDKKTNKRRRKREEL
ncbi:macrophage mannose receptor 1-like isoform X2 [Perca fluviatilis]|nr:macrophage mannose receptor 1-like isoform X2 [Perca fluviatilis]